MGDNGKEVSVPSALRVLKLGWGDSLGEKDYVSAIGVAFWGYKLSHWLASVNTIDLAPLTSISKEVPYSLMWCGSTA